MLLQVEGERVRYRRQCGTWVRLVIGSEELPYHHFLVDIDRETQEAELLVVIRENLSRVAFW